MSRYEDYATVSKFYDETRVPIGTDILLGCLGAAGVPLTEVRLLDAGCGTGAYSRAMLPHVGRVDSVDLNEGMLAVARAKLADEEAAGRIAFHQGSIDALLFEDASFDAAMINQVLHHIEDGADPSFPAHEAVIAEMHRVLRPGGVLVINMCTREQLSEGYWYYDLVPQARKACIRCHVPTERLQAMLTAAGFQPRAPEPVLDAVMQGKAYFDMTGPLSESWRKGDSFWALATDAQVKQAEARLREMQAAGTLEAWFHERDGRRKGVGQFTFFSAVKRRE
ncbi:MAG: class I SAM-dependent methyltransferase [Proteobacteria bacterium]|nr:class I SAM-dependent methyltransferase [Pseudomonadota bacterium]